MSYSNKNTRITNIFFLLSVGVVIFIIFNWFQIPTYHRLIIFFPLIFGIYLKFGSLDRYINGLPSLMLFIILCFVRYDLLPFVNVANNSYYTFRFLGSVNNQDNVKAYLLMIYELVAIIITIEYFLKYYFSNINFENNKKYRCLSISKPNYIYYLSILIGIGGLLAFPYFIKNIIFFSLSNVITKEQFHNNFITVILFTFVVHIQTFLFLIIIKRYGLKSCLYKRKTNLPIIVLISAILNFIILWNTNRTTILVNVIVTIIILSYVFPKKIKTINYSFLSIGLIMVILMTFYRSFYSLGYIHVNTNDISSVYGFKNVSSYLEAYVSGQNSVLNGIKTASIYHDKISFETLINDTFLGTNFMQQVIRHFTDIFNNNTQRYFNIYSGFKYFDSLIIPSVAEGYIFFGFLGAPIFTILTLILMLFAEKHSLITKDLGLKYAWMYLALFISGIPGSNWIITIQFFSRQFIPLYLIMKSNIVFSKYLKKS